MYYNDFTTFEKCSDMMINLKIQVIYVGDWTMSKKTLDEIQELKVLISQLKEFCETIRDILHDKDILEIGRDSCFDNMAYI